MGKYSARLLAAVTAAVAACVLAPAGTGSAGGATHAAAGPGTRLWLSRFSGARGTADAPASMAVSPGGRRVFVTGFSAGHAPGDFGDYATVAYDAQTGARLWARRYNGPGKGTDLATSVAVSPSGTMVFVTGSSMRSGSVSDYATIAYNAATGARLWVRRFGPGGASAVTAGRDGRVFVTGSSLGDFATVAYRAATGTRLWVTRYDGPGHGFDECDLAGPQPRCGDAVRDRAQRERAGCLGG